MPQFAFADIVRFVLRPVRGKMFKLFCRWAICWAAAAISAALFHAQATANGMAGRTDRGVFNDRIVVGQSTSLTGPLAAVGAACALGAKAYFSEINARGGIHGRRIELVTRDDSYSIDATLANTQVFLDTTKVFALFGYVGWPGIDAATPLFSKARVPFLFPCTGGPTAYQKFNRYIFTARASYLQEYHHLLKSLGRFGVQNLAMLYQNDSFGKRLVTDVQALPEARRYSIFSIPIDLSGSSSPLIQRVNALKPDGVLLLNGQPTLNVAAVRGMQESGYLGRFFGASIIGHLGLVDALGPSSRGLVITQVVPSPWHASIPLVIDYRKLMEFYGVSEFGFASMEGFIAARVFVEGLRRAGRNLTRERLIHALESINDRNYAHRGFPINFSRTNHNGSSFVETTVVSSHSAYLN